MKERNDHSNKASINSTYYSNNNNNSCSSSNNSSSSNNNSSRSNYISFPYTTRVESLLKLQFKISLTVRHLHDGDDESGHEVPDEVLGPVVPRKPGEHRKDIVRQMGHALLKS